MVFSGDLGADGTAAAFQSGKTLLLEPLKERLPSRPIVIVPGNHDVNRARISNIVETGLRETLVTRATVADLISGEDFAAATARLQDWWEFEARWYEGSPSTFSSGLARALSYTIDGTAVGVACLNTAWRAAGDDDRHRLLLGESQVDGALRAIGEAEIRLVVMHHPLDWLAEFDAAAVRAKLERAGVFVLTGHDHSPDPTMEISTRGAALYSRAGCLYAGHSYCNSYTLLDIDARNHNAHVTVRRWWPGRREIDQATDLHSRGVLDLPWPSRGDALPAHRAALAEMITPLAQIAQEQSVLTGGLPDRPTVTDLLVAPRFWPVPHNEAVNPAVPPDARPQAVDPIEGLDRSRVVIVSGGPFSGVTSSLLWLLERHFRVRGTHLPAFVRVDPRFSLGRLEESLALARARAEEPQESTTPVVVAIDDAAPQDSRALGRMLRFLSDHPEASLLIGTHGEYHASIADTLRERGVTHERVFLGPFGRRELRELVARIVGPGASDLVQRVLRTIHRQRLPRNPLNIAALVSVLTREPELTAVNESGLLQSYVNVLLENPTAIDPEGLAMDYRRREHLLARLAEHMVRSNRARIPRGEIERFVLDYFSEVGWRTGSAGHLVDSLIRRRVLTDDELGVGFRYPALLNLFAAKWVLEDGEFSSYVLDDPIRHREILRHAAGLRRNAEDLLVTVGRVATDALQYGALSVTVGQFDLMEDRHGWSQVRDLDDVRAMLSRPPRPPSEEEIDEIYEEVADNPSELAEPHVFPDEERSLESVAHLEASVSLLASVLQNSELVPDVTLKADLLRKVILGWSISTVVTAVAEDETGSLREVFEEVLTVENDERRRSLAEHLVNFLVVTAASFALYFEVGSIHLHEVLKRILDDDAFMADTAPALFATMLYTLLELPRWPERLRALHEADADHPVVRQLVRLWALKQYREKQLDRRDEAALEELLVEILTPERLPRASVADRAAQRSQILEEVRNTRTRARFSRRAIEGGAEDEGNE